MSGVTCQRTLGFDLDLVTMGRYSRRLQVIVLILIAGFVILISHKRMLPTRMDESVMDLGCGLIGAVIGYWLS